MFYKSRFGITTLRIELDTKHMFFFFETIAVESSLSNDTSIFSFTVLTIFTFNKLNLDYTFDIFS